jgi:hypothetical protein
VIKEGEISRECSMHDGERNSYGNLVGRPEGNRPL